MERNETNAVKQRERRVKLNGYPKWRSSNNVRKVRDGRDISTEAMFGNKEALERGDTHAGYK